LKRIVFASRNRGKISEIGAMLEGSGIQFKSLLDYPDIPDIVEDGNSFLENALKKARTVSEATGETVLAGEDGNDAKNIRKLLDDMKDIAPENRDADFRCLLVLFFTDGRYETFEGLWKGTIAEKPNGNNGFGYDPVFYIPELGVTVAQISSEVKNRLSHRAQALAKLKEKLREGAWKDQ
jgi:XTP/dITP diphosphohydrolase